VLSVYGGKITTYRKLAEQAVDMLKSELNFTADAWTSPEPLPGGDIVDADFDRFLEVCRQHYAWMDDYLLQDYARNYGTRIEQVLQDADSMEALGHHFGGPLYQAEVAYLIAHEFVHTAEDILWRRSKKGLHVPKGTEAELQQWLDINYISDNAHGGLRRVS